MLGGGHYITYAHNPNNRWYCYNDSSCKVSESRTWQTSTYCIVSVALFKIDLRDSNFHVLCREQTVMVINKDFVGILQLELDTEI